MDGWKMSFLLGRPIWRGYLGFSEGKISSNSRCTGHYYYHMFAWHCEAAAARLSGEQESENELLFEDCCFYLTLLWNFRKRIQKQHLLYSGDFPFFFKYEMPLALRTTTPKYPPPTRHHIKCQFVWGGDERCTNARGSGGLRFYSWTCHDCIFRMA